MSKEEVVVNVDDHVVINAVRTLLVRVIEAERREGRQINDARFEVDVKVGDNLMETWVISLGRKTLIPATAG